MSSVRRAVDAEVVLPADAERVEAVLRARPELVFGPLVQGRGAPGAQTDLAVDLGKGSQLSQRVEVALGCPRQAGDSLTVPVAWSPVGRRPVFPSFEGEITVSPSDDGGAEIALHGLYTIPLGALGAFGDGLVGRRLARRSLVALLNDAAGRIAGELEDHATASWRPAPYPLTLRDRGG